MIKLITVIIRINFKERKGKKMKTILDCELGQIYTVKKLHTNGALRQRLISFGILKGVSIKYLNATNLKGTYEIQVG